jgi:hypothetical protein
MPLSAIAKAELRVGELLRTQTASRLDMQRLMGSLRHVATCVRLVANFIQKLSLFMKNTKTRRIPITPEALDDLHWMARVIKKPSLLRGICLEYFCDIGPPDLLINMDASDTGLCAVHTRKREFIRLDFNADEREMIENNKTSPGIDQLSINVRELWSASLAAICWGKSWDNARRRPTRVEFVIDNSSAVSWASSLSSPNRMAHPMLRTLCYTEVKYNVRFTARHIAGVDNDLTDAGSRFHDPERRARFALLTRGYAQVEISREMRDPSSAWSTLSDGTL